MDISTQPRLYSANRLAVSLAIRKPLEIKLIHVLLNAKISMSSNNCSPKSNGSPPLKVTLNKLLATLLEKFFQCSAVMRVGLLPESL